ncbi:MAG: ELM1/GtrOC1 family putative glycosyltransferase [Oleiphilaceae bacterium]|nr:ELM1/GtrOC1 family putative glycosyltransferase [Oleiphilaceae bacterium]
MPPTPAPPVIWLLSDSRPGHQSQLRGLGERLEARLWARIHTIEAGHYPLSLWQTLIGRMPLPTAPLPSLLLAAGHGSHRLLLALRRRLRVPGVVLMTPSFPLSWVDGAIIPAHDRPRQSERVLTVQGVLNKARPVTRLSPHHRGLVLLGGPSRHYHWDNTSLAGQIRQLCRLYPHWQWTLASSRRTPRPLMAALEDQPALTRVAAEDTDPDWLLQQLRDSRAVWVTPDSVSMISEALTSALPTGLLALAPKGRSRVARGVQAMADQGLLPVWPDHQAVMAGQAPGPALQEADRAALWLAQRFFPQHPVRDTDGRPAENPDAS